MPKLGRRRNKNLSLKSSQEKIVYSSENRGFEIEIKLFGSEWIPGM